MQLNVPRQSYHDLQAHLFAGDTEHVAFFRFDVREAQAHLKSLDLLRANDYARRSAYHVGLDDRVRPRIIKWAWDAGDSLGEAHSHRIATEACFSPTDLAGLREWVPHIWWRLQGRPYLALVFGPDSVDGLAWVTSPEDPVALAKVTSADRVIAATGLSLKAWRAPDGR